MGESDGGDPSADGGDGSGGEGALVQGLGGETQGTGGGRSSNETGALQQLATPDGGFLISFYAPRGTWTISPLKPWKKTVTTTDPGIIGAKYDARGKLEWARVLAAASVVKGVAAVSNDGSIGLAITSTQDVVMGEGANSKKLAVLGPDRPRRTGGDEVVFVAGFASDGTYRWSDRWRNITKGSTAGDIDADSMIAVGNDFVFAGEIGTASSIVGPNCPAPDTACFSTSGLVRGDDATDVRWQGTAIFGRPYLVAVDRSTGTVDWTSTVGSEDVAANHYRTIESGTALLSRGDDQSFVFSSNISIGGSTTVGVGASGPTVAASDVSQTQDDTEIVVVAKVAISGVTQWVRAITPASTTPLGESSPLLSSQFLPVVSKAGDVTLFGTVDGLSTQAVDFGSGVTITRQGVWGALVRYDANGTTKWAKGILLGTGRLSDMLPADDGSLLVTCTRPEGLQYGFETGNPTSFQGSATDPSGFILTIDPSGNPGSGERFGAYDAYGIGLARLADGRIVMRGSSNAGTFGSLPIETDILQPAFVGILDRDGKLP